MYCLSSYDFRPKSSVEWLLLRASDLGTYINPWDLGVLRNRSVEASIAILLISTLAWVRFVALNPPEWEFIMFTNTSLFKVIKLLPRVLVLAESLLPPLWFNHFVTWLSARYGLFMELLSVMFNEMMLRVRFNNL